MQVTILLCELQNCCTLLLLLKLWWAMSGLKSSEMYESVRPLINQLVNQRKCYSRMPMH